MKAKSVIIGITGSIAAYKACDLISQLKRSGHSVTVVMTREAEEFITPLTLEALSGNKAYRDMFQLPDKREIAHVSLARKADIIVVCPATANIIGKLAGGICDDLLTCTITSSASPVLIVPAMNDNMYKHETTRKNIRELRKIGYKFVEPIHGKLACGSVGIGHIAGTKEIAIKVNKILTNPQRD